MNEARLTIWDDEACKRMHDATLELLADTGIEVRQRRPLEDLREGRRRGRRHARAHSARLVDDALASAPRDWTIKPRGGDTAPLVLDAATATAARAATCSTSATPTRASAAACARPTSRAWPRSARSSRTSTSS